MTGEHNSGEEYKPFSLSQYEQFVPGETHTQLQVVMNLNIYADAEIELQSMATSEEREAMLAAAIQYAELNNQIDGFRIENKSGHIVNTVIPDTLDTIRHQLLQSGPSSAARVNLRLNNSHAEVLKKLAEDHDCLMGDILTSGISVRSTLKQHYSRGGRIIAVLSNSDNQLAILPLA
ncbi:MAG: hypothetical protein ABWX90_01950 [Candidatus Saccharimonadales bacterium]